MIWLYGLLALAGIIYVIGIVQTRRIHKNVVRYADPCVPKAFDGFRIAQVSDYHNTPFTMHGLHLIGRIRAENPDIIVVTGDLFDRRRPDSCRNAFAFVEQAVRIAPVLFVEGNHERRLKRYPQWRKELISLGVIVLEDETVTIMRGGDALRVSGMRQVFDTNTLQRLCAGKGLSLVLSHRCDLMSQYQQADHALVLTGHAHGGQVRLPGRGVYAPDQGVLPRYTAGLHRAGDALVMISRGIGNSVPVSRLFNTPEWNLIVLTRQMDKGRVQ